MDMGGNLMIDNKVLLERLSKIPQLKLNKHQKSELVNGECVTKNPTNRRKNVIGDINPNGSSFILYKEGKWTSRSKIGIKTIEETIAWIKKDIEILSK